MTHQRFLSPKPFQRPVREAKFFVGNFFLKNIQFSTWHVILNLVFTYQESNFLFDVTLLSKGFTFFFSRKIKNHAQPALLDNSGERNHLLVKPASVCLRRGLWGVNHTLCTVGRKDTCLAAELLLQAASKRSSSSASVAWNDETKNSPRAKFLANETHD